ncbi:MAG: hypothetical protein Fur005_33510 [Roseiflexaceae bacterium]
MFPTPHHRQHTATPRREALHTEDYILVPRSTMHQIAAHVSAEQERTPTRRLRQVIQILQHILGHRQHGPL